MSDEKKVFREGTDTGANRSAIGKRIKIALSEIKISQIDAATALEIPLSTLRNWIQGRSEPDGTHLARISEFTGKSLDWLIKGIETSPLNPTPSDASSPLNSPGPLHSSERILRVATEFLHYFSILNISAKDGAEALVLRLNTPDLEEQVREIEEYISGQETENRNKVG